MYRTSPPPYPHPRKGRDFFTLLNLAGTTESPIYLKQHHLDETLPAFSSLSLLKNDLRNALPLIHSTVTRYKILDELSVQTSDLLRKETVNAVAGEMVNERWLVRVLDLLNKADIPIILLKSAAFSNNLYCAQAPRTGKDLDLLVNQDRFEDVCQGLRTIMRPVIIDKNRPVTHTTLFERVFRPKEGIGPTVEIHKGLTNSGLFDICEKSLWEASTPHPKYNKQAIRVLSPEDTLLHLAVHAFRDLNFCTHNLVDTHEIVSQWKPDFPLLLKRAEQWGARNVLHCLLENCKAVMKTDIPQPYLDEIRPRRARIQLFQFILKSKQLQNTTDKTVGYRLLQLLAQLVFPDRFNQGLQYQFNYTLTRLRDIASSRVEATNTNK